MIFLFQVLTICFGLWIVPIHLVFNFLLTRKLIKRHSRNATLLIAACVNVLLFMPLVVEHNSMYGPLYFPWYLKFLLDDKHPAFSPLGLLLTLLFTLIGSARWIATSKHRATLATQTP